MHNGKMVPYLDLPQADQIAKLKSRLKDYSRKVYKKTHTTKNLVRSDTVCMRENSFYIDTVRDFRDRRYLYKGEHKTWKGKLDKAQSAAEIQEYQGMVVLYESLQLAHKCILNSFYGYVMRKGARWYSMEMAGIVTFTGAKIIRDAREIVEKIGRPLELDTDGIWCIIPSSFPQNFTFKTNIPKRSDYSFSYPIMLLNAKVADKFTNSQYQTLVAPKTYDIRNECSILFEMDGPYKAIVLPASREQDVKLKKRYAVFNKNGTIAELKGFEIKRRGELKLIKDFQAQVFDKFLRGSTLEQCYESVAAVANHYLDVLDSKGSGMEDDELIDLITENANMSRKLEDYEKQKSCAITTAKRLAEFLGDQMIKEKGLACSFIITNRPAGTLVTERALPVAIFSTEPTMQRHFMSQWLKGSTSYALRDIVDWDYYRQRLASSVQKIITIPAALQKVDNPVPRIPHPDWLTKSLRAAQGQRAITDHFQRKPPTAPTFPDMEDTFAQKTNTTVPVAHSVKRKRKDKDELPPLPDSPPPSFSKKYGEWLEHEKAVWKHQREKRKKIRLDPYYLADKENQPQRGNGVSSMSSYLSSHNTHLMKSEWHIIQIRPTSTPGIFVLWAVANDTLLRTQVSVPRTFYINSRIPDQSKAGRKVSMIPPRSKSHQYMYQYTMTEEKYQQNAKELSMQFTHSSIEGVYERWVPLLWRTYLELGSTCHLSRNALAKNGTRDTYPLDDLISGPIRSTTNFLSRPALDYLKHDVKHIYMYHSASELHGAVFVVVRPHQNKGTVILVNQHAAQATNSNLLHPLVNKHPSIQFEIERVKTLTKGYKTLQALLSELARSRGLTVLLLQSFRSAAYLAQNVTALDDFPRVIIPANSADNEYTPLGWEYQAIKVASHRFADVPSWWSHTLQLARYANIPVGNLEGDLTLLTSDLFFARQLKDAHHLLWMSSSNLPDLGGSEEDDAMFAEELVNPELSEPGFYHPFCVEFDVLNLAIDTVLEVVHIGDIEGGSSLASFEGGDGTITNDKGDQDPNVAPKSYDQSSVCTNEFKILRKLITRWSVDVMSSDATVSACADGLLSQFYRWISTPHALLYDPAIHKLIHDLMRKLFMQLMLEFRRFGAKIIFANYNKIIVSTNKETLTDAQAYSEYILSAIKKKDLFAWIHIKPAKYWEKLLWMDRANYGGVEDLKEGKIDAHWNIAEYLPKTIQEYFLVIVTTFIVKSYTSENTSPNDLPNSDSSLAMDDFMDTSAGNSETSGVLSDLGRQLFVIVQDIQRTLSGDHSHADQTSSEFPILAGSHLTMNNPALEFVKFVCNVLALDRSQAQSVDGLKKNLLRLIGTREFSTEASFVNPCLSYILPDVMCEFCNYGRDIDLLRDVPSSSSSSAHAPPAWGCVSCGHPYNRNQMEGKLVEIVQKRDLSYQLQDLVCSKCRSVKASNMGDICSNCSGQWVCKEPLPAFKKSMVVFRNIADYFKFEWLLEVVNTCVDSYQ